jgi:hypothetical protein
VPCASESWRESWRGWKGDAHHFPTEYPSTIWVMAFACCKLALRAIPASPCFLHLVHILNAAVFAGGYQVSGCRCEISLRK